MNTEFLTSLVVFVLLTDPTTQNCMNSHGRTKCENLPSLEPGQGINFPRYLQKFELAAYKGPLRKGVFQNISRIEQLSLNQCEITLIEEDVFCSLPRLKFIYISDSKLPSLYANTLGACCHRLHTIGIQKSNIADIEPGSFQYLNQLDTLLIQFTPVPVLKADMFKGLTQLQHLHLKGDSISTIDEGAFNDLSNLRLLDLSDNKLGSVNVSEFTKMISLEDLYLSNNTLTDLDVTALVDGLPRLQFLGFYYNKVPCDRLATIRSILIQRRIGKQVFQPSCLDRFFSDLQS